MNPANDEPLSLGTHPEARKKGGKAKAPRQVRSYMTEFNQLHGRVQVAIRLLKKAQNSPTAEIGGALIAAAVELLEG